MALSREVNIICRSFVEGLKRILKEKLHGVYVYGAAAFPDTVPSGDIDFHVILTSELTDEERSQLETFHESLAKQFPPLGGELDGYYILLEDARGETPPRSQIWRRAIDESWALHCEHIRAGRHIVLHGPEPTEFYPPASWSEVEIALRGEMAYVEKHLLEHPAYCILNLCRLMYSFETKDVVVSKAQTAYWTRDAVPQWRRHIDLALKSYAHQTAQEDEEFMLAEVERFLEFSQARIKQVYDKTPTKR